MAAKIMKAFWQENRGFIALLGLMFVFRSAVADWNHVPTGSMQPTIEIGDRIFINKMAYDIRVPFTLISLKKLADPVTGDIVIFESEVSENRLVKRVVGVPGDRVSMRDNRLYINGDAVPYRTMITQNDSRDMIEELNGAAHRIRINTYSQRSNFSEVIVPADHYLVLGDNRDNSADSRVIGFVPRHEIIGKSESVVVSLDHDAYFLPRADRFLTALDSL